MTYRNQELKATALALRKQGVSMIVIERQLGVARSTLSYWFKSILLTNEQTDTLTKNKLMGLHKARLASIESKRIQKITRLKAAEDSALAQLSNIDTSDISTLELSLAMLYWGEGVKTDVNSDPAILKFYITAVQKCYSLPLTKIKCDLHLRADQDPQEIKAFWMQALNLPSESFRSIVFDKRTANKPTYSHYKGVCLVYFGTLALQRRLTFLYTHYCNKVASPN